MWRLLLVAGLAAGLAQADEHWLRFQSGPFQVFTDAGARAGREMLVRFEEFRYALGEVIGDTGIQTPQPVRILLFRNAGESDPFRTPEPIHRGRDLFNIVLTSGQPVPPDVFRDATKLFLETAVARMPAHLERGIVEFFSTIEVNGIRITVGKPPAGRDLDWARVQIGRESCRERV